MSVRRGFALACAASLAATSGGFAMLLVTWCGLRGRIDGRSARVSP